MLLTTVLAIVALSAQQDLDAAVRARAAKTSGTLFVYAKNLDTGATYSLRGDSKVPTASTIKLPIMVECYKAVADGRVQWDTVLPLKEADIVSGSGVLFEFTPNAPVYLRDAMHLMIVVSDNTATNLILDKLTANAVNKTMESLGILDTKSLRKVRGDGTKLKAPTGWSDAGLREENKQYGLGVSTPRDMVKLLELLEQGKVVSPAASKEMIEVLKRQQLRDGIARRTGDMPVASKTGALDHLRSDVGILYTPKGRVAIAVTVGSLDKPDYSPDNPGLYLIADVAQLVVDRLTSR